MCHFVNIVRHCRALFALKLTEGGTTIRTIWPLEDLAWIMKYYLRFIITFFIRVKSNVFCEEDYQNPESLDFWILDFPDFFWIRQSSRHVAQRPIEEGWCMVSHIFCLKPQKHFLEQEHVILQILRKKTSQNYYFS